MNYNYDTNKWILINYPPGAGGKFIAACLMLFGTVAHWSKKNMEPAQTVNWYKQSLPIDNEVWFQKEIDTPWVLPASRLWPRGANLSKDEFWEKFNNQVDPWFSQCYNNNKFIVDFWHKQQHPEWWSKPTWINLIIDDVDLYKDLLFSKVFNYNQSAQTVSWVSQRPELGRSTTLFYKSVYQNQWHWDNVKSRDEFYNNVIANIPGFNWDFDNVNLENHIKISDLFDVDRVENFLLKFETLLGSKLDQASFRKLHAHWVDTTTLQLLR
jgi:hypothetical protein